MDNQNVEKKKVFLLNFNSMQVKDYFLTRKSFGFTDRFRILIHTYVLKYGSEEKGSSLSRFSIFLGFIMSKKQGRLCSELLSEDKITNLSSFLT